MCGILAIYSNQFCVDEQRLSMGLEKLHHRGPDGRGTYIAEDGRLGLGHTRLSIIDLETGAQPIANETKSIWAVVNGEFYQFEEIRADLQKKGHRFHTASDSEILVHLYEEHGDDCVSHLRGEFAFLLWDEANGKLLAGRDRFGIKPLYYTRVGETFYFASEIKALISMGVSGEWDHEAFAQQLFLFCNLDRTLFKGVFQVKPGHLISVRAGEFLSRSYWDLDYPERPNPAFTEDDHRERFLEKLEEAVRIRLRSDVPVASFLSGGLDSSSILGLASRHVPDPISAFTVTFDHPAYDEGNIARETAAFLGVHYIPVPLSASDFAEHLEKGVAHGEFIGVNMHGLARFLQCRAVHETGFKVALTGEGADEILGGYGHSRKDLLSANTDETPSQLRRVREMLGFVPAWLRTLAVDRSIFHMLLSPDFEKQFGGRDHHGQFLEQYDLEGQLKGRDPVFQSLYLWSRSVLPNYILLTDRMEMAFSVETRLPFLDHILFETVREMPVNLLIREMKEKFILRETLRPLLTPTVYERTKHPFTAPHATLNPKNPMFAMIQDVLRSKAFEAVPFFDVAAVAALLDALPEMSERERVAFDPVLTMMVCVCLLQQHYKL